MIRVLHYGMSPNLGGIETYLLNLANNVDPARFQFDFLYSDLGSEPIFAAELATQGSRFYGVTPRRTSPRRNRQDLEALFAEESFDTLHFHTNTVSYVEPVRAALRHGVRVIVHSHNAGASRSRVTRALHVWHRRTLPWDKITRVAVSGEAGRWMFGNRSFDVLHNGIDAEAFSFRPEARRDLRRSLGITADAFVVGSVAAFLPAKNHEFLMRVFAQVAQRDPAARLVLVGAGPLETQVREQVRELGLETQVHLLGRRSDIPEILAAMDALLLPSRHEGFPLVVLEAQASGLPCLLSDAVTSEVGVGPACQHLPLHAEPSRWAAALLASAYTPRSLDGPSRVHEAGLSVARATERVAALYELVADGQPPSTS